MRIGIAIASFRGGGAEFVARSWSRELIARGHDVYGYTYLDGDETDVPVGMTLSRLPTSSHSRSYALTPWLAQRSGADKLDVLLTMMTYMNLSALVGKQALRNKTPIVISERNVPTTRLPLEGRSGAVQRRLAKSLYRSADGVVAISHAVAADLIGGYSVDPGDTFVVPNPASPAHALRPQKLTADKYPITLAFVGRLVEQKRPMLFVEIVAEMTARGWPTQGAIVGSGTMEHGLRSEAASRALAIRFLGWKEPWQEHIPEADCLVLPSSVEGFGNVLVEAASVGIPSVAASQALGVSDAIVPGVTGNFAAAETAADFADAIERTLLFRPTSALDGWFNHFGAVNSTDILFRALTHAVS